MAIGFDFNHSVSGILPALAARGCEFVGRYYNHNNPYKNLTPAEAKAISAAGMSIIAVWENGFPTSAEYFDYQKGVFDGTSAYHYALRKISQPSGTAIYFTVDYDAREADLHGPVQRYFSGVHDAFHTISAGAPAYAVGVYGSGLVCSTLRSTSHATYTWLSQSRGWTGTMECREWNIKQGPGTVIGGLHCDSNETTGNGGGFKV